MIRIKLKESDAIVVSRALLEQRDKVPSDAAKSALREAAVQVLEQVTDMRIGTLYVHLDSPNTPWMLMDLRFNDQDTKVMGTFSRKSEDDYESSELADWRTF